MRSPRLGYPAFALIALAGAGVVALGLGVVVGDVRLTGSAGAVGAACWRFVFPTLSLQALLVLALGSLGTAVIVRGLASAARQAVSNRRLHRRQQPVSAVRVAGQRAIVVRGSSVQAFTSGLLRPRVCLSEGALARLDSEQLELPLALLAAGIAAIAALAAIALQLHGATAGRDEVNPAQLVEQLCLVLKTLLPLVLGAALILRALRHRPS